MAWTQEDLDALDEQIKAVGTVKATSFDNQSTTFRDIEDLLKLREQMVDELAAAGRNRTRFAAFSKGA